MAKRSGNQVLRRYLRYPLEAAGFYIGLLFFRCLPVDWASNVGGWLARAIGPRLGINRRAERNLQLAFPGIGPTETATIIRGMWDNLGRVLGEYAHLKEICAPDSGRVEGVSLSHADPLRQPGTTGIVVSGHLANWEVMQIYASRELPDTITVTRDPNNPHVHALLERLRGGWGGRRVPKGLKGSRQVLAAMKKGAVLGALIDQKMNDGIAVPFFGLAAMTAPAVGRLALRFDCPIIPTRIERTGPARFRLTCYPPVALPDSGDTEQDVLKVMTELNTMLEAWIRDRPAEWLWLHRRWPKETYSED